MEFDYEDEKIGGGIITLSVLHFIMSALTMLGGVVLLTTTTNADVQKQLATLNIDSSALSTGSIIFNDIILRILLIVFLILILRKNKIGVYGYYLFVLVNIVSTIITNGFNILSIILSLIFPILMGIFISKKKNIFGL